jgi:hypothetical protein
MVGGGNSKMKFQKSEPLGMTESPEGQSYLLHFRGENEGAATITGPVPTFAGKMIEVPEVHREPATDPDDARAKLATWIKAKGWRPAIWTTMSASTGSSR